MTPVNGLLHVYLEWVAVSFALPAANPVRARQPAAAEFAAGAVSSFFFVYIYIYIF